MRNTLSSQSMRHRKLLTAVCAAVLCLFCVSGCLLKNDITFEKMKTIAVGPFTASVPKSWVGDWSDDGSATYRPSRSWCAYTIGLSMESLPDYPDHTEAITQLVATNPALDGLSAYGKPTVLGSDGTLWCRQQLMGQDERAVLDCYFTGYHCYAVLLSMDKEEFAKHETEIPQLLALVQCTDEGAPLFSQQALERLQELIDISRKEALTYVPSVARIDLIRKAGQYEQAFFGDGGSQDTSQDQPPASLTQALQTLEGLQQETSSKTVVYGLNTPLPSYEELADLSTYPDYLGCDFFLSLNNASLAHWEGKPPTANVSMRYGPYIRDGRLKDTNERKDARLTLLGDYSCEEDLSRKFALCTFAGSSSGRPTFVGKLAYRRFDGLEGYRSYDDDPATSTDQPFPTGQLSEDEVWEELQGSWEFLFREFHEGALGEDTRWRHNDQSGSSRINAADLHVTGKLLMNYGAEYEQSGDDCCAAWYVIHEGQSIEAMPAHDLVGKPTFYAEDEDHVFLDSEDAIAYRIATTPLETDKLMGGPDDELVADDWYYLSSTQGDQRLLWYREYRYESYKGSPMVLTVKYVWER